MINKVKGFITAIRAPFLTATIVSVFLGTAIAFTRNNAFNPWFFLLALAGGIFLHAGANIANDYFDHRSGNDDINTQFVRPFSGGSRTIQLGLLSPREVLGEAIFFYTAAVLIGVYFALTVGIAIFIIGLVGVLSGFFYTAPYLNWAGRGIGEVLVGVNFGALMTLGAYYVQTGVISLEPLAASIPIALLITAVLYINEFPDYAADKQVGKNNWVVRLGKAKAVYGYAAIVLGAYIFILLNAVVGITPLQVLLALIPLPLAIEGIRYAFKFHSESSFKLAPANALTIAFHFLTSILIACGYLLYKFEGMSLAYFSVIAVVGVCTLLTIQLYMKTKKPPAK